ncbi:MAG: hypothetical protein AAGE52_25555 [Myxococcota bacterium]
MEALKIALRPLFTMPLILVLSWAFLRDVPDIFFAREGWPQLVLGVTVLLLLAEFTGPAFRWEDLKERRRNAELAEMFAGTTTISGVVIQVLDGAEVAACTCHPFPPFVARFLVRTEQGVVCVDGGDAVLKGVEEVRVGDAISVLGTRRMEAIDGLAGPGGFRGQRMGWVFRGTPTQPVGIFRPNLVESFSASAPRSSGDRCHHLTPPLRLVVALAEFVLPVLGRR